jgi:YrbI family 3-deoxy-D-manno-octulosonate 8-phosphate phosphatase
LSPCDVDGVLTDSRIYMDDHGQEFKAYSAVDGYGLKMLMRAGVSVGWITGQQGTRRHAPCPAAWRPSRHQGAEDKFTPWEKLRIDLGLAAETCAHIGDDLPDVPLFNRCGPGGCRASRAGRGPCAGSLCHPLRRRPGCGTRVMRIDPCRAECIVAAAGGVRRVAHMDGTARMKRGALQSTA